MAGSRPYRKHPPRLPGEVQSQTPAPLPVRTPIQAAGGTRWGDEEPPVRLESDLSGDMPVGDQELDAIIRLLGGAFDGLLSGAERE
jgi:hypothetical protein